MDAAASRPGRTRVHAFVPYPPDTAPSQRFRIEQWMPYLAEAGVDVTLRPFADAELDALLPKPGRAVRKSVLMLKALARTVRAAAAVPRGDFVLVHRAACLAGPAFVERRLRARGLPLVFDFDDAIYRLHTSDSNRAFGWLKAPGKTAAICRLASHVAVGNAHLAAWAVQHNPRVTVVPTSIDTDRCRPRPEGAANPRVVVGWTGSATSQAYLEAHLPMLRALTAAANVELRVLSNRAPDLPGVPHSWRPWSPAVEDVEIAGFDIGIMPLFDEEWARGKCALKALQYMAAGVATVASPVGTNVEVIQHGENGLLARSEADWMAALTALVDEGDLRRRIGRAGRQTVLERYSMRATAARFAEVVREVIERERGPAAR